MCITKGRGFQYWAPLPYPTSTCPSVAKVDPRTKAPACLLPPFLSHHPPYNPCVAFARASSERLWTYDVDSGASLAAAIPGLAVCNAGLRFDCASVLVSAGLHLCLLKDWIAALAISRGSLFLDLDYIWLGSQSLLVDGLAFGTEPIKLLQVLCRLSVNCVFGERQMSAVAACLMMMMMMMIMKLKKDEVQYPGSGILIRMV